MDTPSKNQARRYSVEQWEQMKPRIRDIIVNERQKLKEVIRIIDEDLGFAVSEKQLKSRITKWGFDTKNVKGDAMLFMARTQAKRKRFENKESAFRVHKQPVDSAKISRYLKRKEISESSLLDIASPVDAPSPAISVFTPRPDSPPPGVVCSSCVQPRYKSALPSPSSSSRLVPTEQTVAADDSSPRPSHLPTCSGQISPLCLIFLQTARLFGLSICEANLRRDIDWLSQFGSRLIQSEHNTERINIADQGVYATICFKTLFETIEEHTVPEIAKILVTEDISGARSNTILILRAIEQLQLFLKSCTIEARRAQYLQILLEKFSGTLRKPFQQWSLARILFYHLKENESDEPFFGASFEVFRLIVLSVHSNSHLYTTVARVSWSRLLISLAPAMPWHTNYAGLCWAAAEEYWRQEGISSPSESNKTFPGVANTSQSHAVDGEEQQSNSESLSRRLQKFIIIFAQIDVRLNLFKTDYYVPDGRWELDLFGHDMGMKFVP